MSRLAMLLLASSVLVLAACGGNGSGTTPNRETPGTISSGSPTTPEPALSSERGADPIFWRTSDNFASIEPGKAYKVLFRITGGYAEPALRITATCQTCQKAEQRTPIVIESQMAQPVGQDAPGSYYPTSLELPEAGRWTLNVIAGDKPALILIDVHKSDS